MKNISFMEIKLLQKKIIVFLAYGDKKQIMDMKINKIRKRHRTKFADKLPST
jgi:hypothetical protein